jgi:dienelactone hydrolase
VAVIRTVTLLLTLLAGACGAVPEDAGDGLALTWERAYLYLPVRRAGRAVAVGGRRAGDAVAAAERAIPSKIQLPTVLFAHGCTGFGEGGRVYARLLAGAGYAVFAPASFARPGRPRTCNVKTHRTFVSKSVFEQVRTMRTAEIRYALERLAEIPWVDTDNLFLVGHSQGGGAVSAYVGGGIKARVISGSTCSRGYGAAPSDPVLAVYSINDLWFGAVSERCRDRVAGTALEIVEVPGRAHLVGGTPEGGRAIVEFLTRHTETR